jgi:hypothetical protein
MEYGFFGNVPILLLGALQEGNQISFLAFEPGEQVKFFAFHDVSPISSQKSLRGSFMEVSPPLCVNRVALIRTHPVF